MMVGGDLLPIVLAQLLLAGPPPPPRPPAGLALVCSTQAQLFTHLSSMGSLCCAQLGEACATDSFFPVTCLSLECVRTVRRVSAACGPLLNSSGFYNAWRDELAITVEICQREAPPSEPGNEYALTAPLRGNAALTACPNASGTPRVLVGYAMPEPAGVPPPPPPLSAVPAAVFSAPPGQAVRLDFTALWLPPGATLLISSGSIAGREIASLSGSSLPTQAIEGEVDKPMRVELSVGGVAPAGRGLIAFSADLACQCVSPGSCGPHGRCSQLFGCMCDGGYFGPRCADASCIGVQCGPHGRCSPSGGAAPGGCTCDEGYAGPGCDRVTGPCAGDYTVLGDDHAWRRNTAPAGTHCDAPNPGFGRGPFTPLANRWYRFTGQVGPSPPAPSVAARQDAAPPPGPARYTSAAPAPAEASCPAVGAGTFRQPAG